MKKVLYSTLAACSLFALASCSSDEPVQATGEGDVVVTVMLPEQLATRAFGEGTSATRLMYAVYEGDDDTPIIEELSIDDAFNANLQHEMTLKLVNGKQYNIIFWAQDPNCNAYTFDTTTKQVGVTYDDRGTNGNSRDAFFASDTFTVNGSDSRTVVLKRPFSQVNIGTDDLDQAAVVAIKDNLTTYFTTQAYGAFNLETGDVVGTPETITLPAAGRPLPENEAFPVAGYKYLSCDYLLVENEEAIQEFDIFFVDKANSAEPFNTITIPNVRVNRNWRTNIFGSLLTSDQKFIVEIDPIFEGEYQVVYNASALKAALEAGGKIQLEADIEGLGDVAMTGAPVINLNGHNITGAHLTASGSGTKVTILGEGTVTGNAEDGGVINAVKGATITIEGGNYVAGVDANGDTNSCIFAEGGNVIINGGTFKCQLPYHGKWYVLNVQNGSAGTITCNGGVFYNQDPSNGDDHDGGTFLGEGCTVTSEVVGDDTVYTVTK